MLTTNHTEEELKTSGIYKITVIETGEVYIGSTKSFIGRFRDHKRMMKNGKHHNTNLKTYSNLQYSLLFCIEEEVVELDLLWEKELFYIYKYRDNSLNKTNFTKSANYTSSFFSIEQVNEIAEMYNNGFTCSQVSLEIFNTRDYRSSINNLVKGISYPNFKHLFEYREFTQQGKKRGTFSCSPKYRNLSYKDKLEAVKKDTEYIIKNIGKMSGRGIAKELNLCHSLVNTYIKNYKIDNNIFWEERLTDDIKSIYTKKYGKKTKKYNLDNILIEEAETTNHFKKQGFYSDGIKKSSNTGKPYKGFIFKIENNEL